MTVVATDGLMPCDVLVEGDRIAGFAERGAPDSDGWQRIDGQGRYLYPGMIDLLQHGMGEHLYGDAEQGAVQAASEKLLAHGTTGFLPSIGCLSPDATGPTLTELARQCRLADGARAIGLHSEGPCFGMPGAHNPENVARPSVGLAEHLIEASDGLLRAVTLAPELPEAEKFARRLARDGVSVHLGHSKAPPEEVPRYLDWGINAVTHVYNVLPDPEPDGSGVHKLSLIDAVMAERGLALGVVADGIHTHPRLLAILAQLPADRVFLETDAMKFAGTPGMEFEFYPGYWVRSAPGKAVRDRNGGLCGSSLTPDEAMRNYMKMGGADLVQASHATSLVPARVLGMEDDMGSIAPGKLADFVLLDADTLAVEVTVIGGVERYRRTA
ncbi:MULTISPECIES: amidohydrolase family protein [unclassified Roseitalea]|uniref:N-acetylglucosamine-6-phosphate deacetylase n=1 Tax=unclassified Roseitalea TaxID=2639107 RepID=UPI00273D9BDA|nr:MULTISPECIES: amidohydrolase family protein [unclassified Roseitalea]